MNGEFDPNLPLENPESAEIPYLLRFGGDGGEMDGDRFSPPSESVASQPPSVSSLEGKIPGVRVIRYVACGGMGFVYEAEQEKLGPRRVALKLLRSGFGPRGREQFQIEANVAASMLHPALVACFQAGVVNGWPYLLIQWIPGRSLAELLDEREALKQGGISLHEALDYTEQAAEAIGAAHGAGYLHLDLKPANLMLTPEGNIRVLDFGLALSRPQKDASAASSAGLTPGYAAPEQKQPGDPLGPQADIFSLMATFYHLLTGVRPDVGCEPPSALTGVDGAVDGDRDTVLLSMPDHGAAQPGQFEPVPAQEILRHRGEHRGVE